MLFLIMGDPIRNHYNNYNIYQLFPQNRHLKYMKKQSSNLSPDSNPNISPQFDEFVPSIQHLSLKQQYPRKCVGQGPPHPVKVGKKLKRKYKPRTKSTRIPMQKNLKIIQLESQNTTLKAQIDKLNRKIQNCSTCSSTQKPTTINDRFLADLKMQVNPCQNEIKKLSNENIHFDNKSAGSMEFQNIDFALKGICSKEMDDFSWVYLGTLMIAMGSCCTDFDGNLNVFKVKKESVDALRRQVEKSEQKISMDFFMKKQSLQQDNMVHDDIGFDPFINKIQPGQGLILDTVRVQSVEQFELLYDNHVTFKLKYQALIAAMQYIREHSWISMF